MDKGDNKIIIYGDYFDSNTRSIISILKYCNIAYKLQETSDPELIQTEEST